jgi:hypothetical protein
MTTQEKFQKDAQAELAAAANTAVTKSVLSCADGANKLLGPDPAAGTDALGGCINQRYTADGLRISALDAAKRSGQASTIQFEMNKELIGTPEAQQIFADFEKNFSMSGEDFASAMISAGGNMDAVEAALRKKFSEADVQKILAAAKNRARELASEGKAAYELAKPIRRSAGPSAAAKLRESLRESMAEAEPEKKKKPEAAPEKKKPKAAKMEKNLTPMTEDPLFTNAAKKNVEEGKEETLFDVVQKKYHDKWRLFEQNLEN